MDTDRILHAQFCMQRHGFLLEVALDVPKGVTVLFGPSGSGKSTTLAAIAGLLLPSAGRISLGGEVWFDAVAGRNVAVHERRIAFVFQSLALFPHLTATGNVTYGLPRALSRDERRQRAIALLERLKVPHLASRLPHTFSGGEAQRVALARAFAMAPKLVLMDEPFSAMDQKLRGELSLEVRAFVDELAIPMIFVTHHHNEARAIGDRAVLIESGKIVTCGSVQEVLGANRA